MTVAGKDRRELIQEIRTLRTHLGRLERRNAERTKPDRELPESLEQFKAIFDDAPVGLYRTTPDGRILAANSALVSLLGYRSFDELARRNLENEGYEPACPRSVFKERIEREGKVIGLESAWKKSDGTTLYVRESAQAVRDKLGKTLYYQGTVEDVTEQRQVKKALRESEQLFVGLAANLREGVNVVDENLRCLFANPAGEEIFGVGPGGLVGRTLCEFVSDQGRAIVEEQRSKRREGIAASYDLEIIRPDGQKRQLIVTGTPRFSQEGKYVGAIAVFFDVTEKKQAEQALRSAHDELEVRVQERTAELQRTNEALQAEIAERVKAEKLISERARIIDSTTDSVIMTDAGGVVTLWNRGAERIFGYTSEEMLGQPIGALYSEEGQGRLAEIVQALLRGEEIATTEVTCVHKDGSLVELALSLLPLKDDSGNVTDFVGISKDITEHKRAQEALRQSENRYRTVIENAGEGIVVVQDGKLRFVNARHTLVTGRSQEESTSRPFAEFIHPEDREKVAGIHAARLRGEPVPRVYEFRIIDKDGQTKWLENNGVVIEWDGKPASLNFLRDITARRLAEEALREREETIRALVETSRDWIWSIGINGVHTYCNPAVEQILGYCPDELVGKQSLHLIHDDDRKMVEANLPTWIAEKRGWNNLLVRWRHKDGTYRYMESNAVPILSSENKLVGFRGVDRDITERKKAEEELRIGAEILDNMIEGVHITDEKGIIVLTNPGLDAMFGYERGELIGRHVSILNNLPQEENARFVQSVINQLQTDGTWSGDICNIKKDGTQFISSGRISTLNLSGKKYWISVQHDITDRKRAEEEKFKLLKAIETAKESISITTPDGVIVYGNEAMDDLFGYEKGELIGQHVSVLTSGPGAESLVREALTALEEKGHWEGEVVNKKKDGTEFITYATTSAVKDEKGNIVNLVGTQYDITERKKAEDALRESEERFRKVFEEGPIGMVLTSRDLKFFSANPAFCKMLGYTQEEMSSKTFLDVTHPAHRDADRENVEKMWRGEIQHYATEKRYLAKNGEVRCGSLSASLLRGQDGEPLYALAMIEDITERQRIQETLRETTGLLETIFAHTHILVAYLDPQFNFVRVNRAYAEADGREPSFFVGRNHFALYPNAENEAIFRKVVEIGVPYFAHAKPFEYAEHPERGVGYWDWSLVPIKQQDGVVSGLVLTLVNMTEQKRAEQALWESERHYHSLAKLSPVGIFRTDVRGDCTYINERWCEIAGMSPEEGLGRGWAKAIHPDDQKRVLDQWCQSVQGKKLFRMEYRFRRPDGAVTWVQGQATGEKDIDGQIVGYVGTVSDITELKHAEQALQEREATLTSIFRAAPVGIGLERDCVLARVNDQVCSMLGYSREELVGRCAAMFYPGEDDYEPVRSESRRQILEKGTATVETQWKRKDGRIIDVLLSTIVLDPADFAKGVTFTALDITERKAAEESLRESEEKFRTLAEQSPNMIFINKKGRIVYANRKCEEIMEYTREEFYRPDFDFRVLVAPESADVIKENFVRHLRGQDIKPYDYCLISKQGRRIEAINASKLIQYEGETAILGIITDITERKQAEKRLQFSEERLKRAQSMALIGNWEWDLQKGTLHWEEENYRMFGLPRETIPTVEGFLATVHPDDLELVKRSMDAALKGEPYDLDFRIRRPEDGTERVIHANAKVTWDAEGNPMCFFGTVQDVTERKKVEQSLRESQERLKILFESAPDAIYVTDLKGRFVDGNRAAEEMVGFTKAEVIGKSLAESGLLSGEDLSKAAVNLRKVAAGEPSGPSEYAVRRKNGSMIDIEVRTFPVRIGGEILSLGIARDITARKHAEEAIKASEKKFRSIFETAANLITSVNEQGIIIDCNNRVREFLGYEKEEILGRSMARIIHPDYLGKAQNTLKEILTRGFSYNKEYKMVRKDGSLIDVSIDSSAIEDEHGKYTRTLCIIDDMTDYKQAQQKLLDDREQLKSLASQLSLTEDRERHRLAGVLHDQIGQSLVISKIKLDQLRKSGTSGAIVKALDEVSACLGQVIGDTRTLTFDLSYPILYELGFEAAVAEWLTEHIQEKHGIETDFEDDGQPKPLDDDIRALLFRNVRELLINVVKHARAQRVKVTTRRLKDQIRTSVEDDGVGFDPVEVTAMAAKKAEFGLFSIRERLEQLGGLFEVVSAPGQGTRITMTAPLKQTADEEQG